MKKLVINLLAQYPQNNRRKSENPWSLLAKLFSLAACPLMAIFFVCSDHRNQEQKILARVGDRTISQADFVLRAEQSPEISFHEPAEKRQEYLLDLLINEKLAALAAEKMGLDKSTEVQQLSSFIEDMALSRELYRREVQSKVKVSTTDLEQATKRQAETRIVEYLSFHDRTVAQLYQCHLRAGMPLGNALRELYGQAADTTSSRRMVKWGENDAALEDAVYRLQPGQVSPVVPVAGGFIVMKLLDIQYDALPTETDNAQRKTRGQRILTARREAEISVRFVAEFMQNQQVHFNELLAKELAAAFTEQAISYHNNDQTIKPERPLDQQGWISARNALRRRLAETFVSFAGGQFSLSEILEKWQRFDLPVNHRDANACRRSIAHNISFIVRDTLLAREARRRGYANLPGVLKDVQMWRDYYLYAALEAQRKPTSAEFSWQEYLAELKSTYSVQIDSVLLRQTHVTDIPVIAVRPGQYSALVAPPWPSFN